AAILDVDLAFGVAEEHAAEAVPFDLEEIFRRAERRLRRSRLHRAQLRGEALELDLELVGIHRPQIRARRYEALLRALLASAGCGFSRVARCFLAASTEARSASMRSMTFAGCGVGGASMTSPSILAWTTFITASRYSSL